jgi:hypothetical protein
MRNTSYSMNKSKIILTGVIFFVVTRELPSQQVGPQPMPYTGPYAVPSGQPVIPGQPYLQGPPMIQQGAPAAPIYPPQSTVVPLPSQAPGSLFAPPQVQPLPLPAGAAPPGVVVEPQPGLPGQPLVPTGPPNTIMVPVADEQLTWDQIVDVVHDYFPIARELRARRSGEAWTEGRIETVPQTGATVLEPHKRDSVGSFNRWESTFQSIRRRAILRVIPDPNGYLVEVTVEKELEDLVKPERGRVGPTSFGSELTLPSKRLEEITRTHSSPRWIQLGRDPALEQRMLADIHARLNGITGQGSVFGP